MSERDPRVDPKPGDDLIFGPQWQLERYLVLGNANGVVRYQMGPMRSVLSCDLDAWREWSAGGEVILRAEDSATGRKE